ncbi:MAG: SPFH domain-containing protein [Desulfobacterales bacterium]|jgi:membrane protease subunit (stomatin/prohibitin family)|nr:SPFH domain-containing protein [Desulfobacterales bacterium]
MNSNHLVFLENIEWLDDSGRTLVQRFPEKGSGEIKYGAQLTVRESQSAVFFYQGKAMGVFGRGRHTLKTANIPILTKIASLPWAMSSPLRAEVYFVNLKVFTNYTWGTRDPVAFKDSQLGLIRLRAFGLFNFQVFQPVLFINTMVGTQGLFTTDAVEEYLSRVILSRFNDFMGEKIDSILNLPARYDELSEGLQQRLSEDFVHFGLRLTHLYINAVTPPPDVQKAIDDRSRMGVFQDMDKLMKMKAAMAMEKASETEGGGMGMAMGFMMPAMFSRYFEGTTTPDAAAGFHCPECNHSVPGDAKFCPACGHQIVVFRQCPRCGKNLTPTARFCSRCGHSAEEKLPPKHCVHCSAELLPNTVYCGQCGEKN